MELLSAKQARQISEKNTINNTFVKNNLEYILEKIVKEANKGEYHIYISKSELSGKMTAEKMTIEQIQKLGYNVHLSNDMYKISW
jgi:hypothetical protein